MALKHKNLRCLRRYLGYTQKDFIDQFATDENGKAKISVATFSNLEARGGSRLQEVLIDVSTQLGIDVAVFGMNENEFAQSITRIVPMDKEKTGIWQISSGKNSTNQVLYRLTMYLADEIFEGRLKKGDKIESDRMLAEKFGVGRSVIREALKVLDVLNMLDIRPGQGTFISNEEASFFVIPLSWSLFLNSNQIDDILDVRNTIEVRAAELAAKCSNEKLLSKLHDITVKMHNAYMKKDQASFLDTDLDFHICIAECSENSVIVGLSNTISNLMRRISGTGMVDFDQIKTIHEEHNLIYGAILMHNPDAAGEHMKNHLKNSMKRYNYQ